MPRCSHCPRPLPLLARAHARYCSPACRAAAARQRKKDADLSPVPASMRAARRWVRLTRAGIAMTPQGRAATPDTWTTYAKANRSSIGELGFVIGSGFVCLLVRGQTSLVLDQLPPTYVEATPPTVRVWGTGEIAARRARGPSFDVEVLAADRVAPVTGHPHESAPNILADLSTFPLLTSGR